VRHIPECVLSFPWSIAAEVIEEDAVLSEEDVGFIVFPELRRVG
jgi:hypothetical protein